MCISSLQLWRAMVKVHSAALSSSQSQRAGRRPVAVAPPPDHQPAVARPRRVHGSDEQPPPEVFTIWMKSLVLNGSGCTVFDSAGSIVYRVDNYGSRRSADVCLMDVAGNVVLQILKKKVTNKLNLDSSDP